MVATSLRRTDKWWEARYAKSQARIERAQVAALAEEPPIPYVAAVSTVTGRDGSQYMLRLIPPGEPLDHVGRFAVVALLIAICSRGLMSHSADNVSWIAVVERQRGPWRGFERVEVRHFAHYADAAHFIQNARQGLERAAGEPGWHTESG